MEKLQGFTDHVMLYVKTLVKWLLAAALIGTVGGAVGSLFHLGVEYATSCGWRFLRCFTRCRSRAC